jgi:hypothetical protein
MNFLLRLVLLLDILIFPSYSKFSLNYFIMYCYRVMYCEKVILYISQLLSALASDMLNKNSLIITAFAVATVLTSLAASLQGAITVCGATQCQMSGARSLWLAIKLSGQTVT